MPLGARPGHADHDAASTEPSHPRPVRVRPPPPMHRRVLDPVEHRLVAACLYRYPLASPLSSALWQPAPTDAPLFRRAMQAWSALPRAKHRTRELKSIARTAALSPLHRRVATSPSLSSRGLPSRHAYK